MNEIVFSLDIGTRKIAAFVTRKQDNSVEVLDFAITSHKSRAVRSGQIHDIEAVVKSVIEIKQKLEKNTGLPLKKVATAIAGRNLKCYKSSGHVKFETLKEITQDDTRQAKLAAIHSIISEIGHEVDEYYFIGHTVVKWEIDGDLISHAVGHKAQELKVELIATFLPRKTLESLFSVVKKADLEISYLTLEPIAASEAVLPQNMRHIPLVLIDIGAGTSDIAIISKGSVQSFGMIPMAGDSVTEFICGQCLVDFNEGEKIKKELSSQINTTSMSQIAYKDIFSREYNYPSQNVLDSVRPAVTDLAQRISEEIKKSGHLTANFAVVLVGGGGLTPSLDKELATALGISEMRVGLRTPSMVDRFVFSSPLLSYNNSNAQFSKQDMSGPHTAVGLGISLLAAEAHPVSIVHVMVNDKKVELINFKGSELNVFSALVAAGISKHKIYGKPGLAKTYTLNGELKVIRGEMPTPARITIDNNQVDLNTPLKEGDRVYFHPASDGKDAKLQVVDILPKENEFTFIANNTHKTLPLPAEITINGDPASLYTEVEDRDVIDTNANSTLYSALLCAGVNIESLLEQRISVDVSGKIIEKAVKNYIITHNGNKIDNLDSLQNIAVNQGDSVKFEIGDPVAKISNFVSVPPAGRYLKIKINGEEFVFPGGPGRILLNGRDVDSEHVVKDGDIIRTVSGRDAEAALVDIFKYISVEPKDTVGKRLKLFVNQEEANFTTPLTEGADVMVSFE